MSRNRPPLALTVALLLIAAAFVTAGAEAQAPRVIKIKGSDAMKYDVTKIEAKPGEQLKIQLSTVSSMPKQEMAHNFVLLAQNTPIDIFVLEAAMARASNYIPPAKKSFVLASTELAGGGETVEVTFNAPKEPGEYLYICTFPGHYVAGMKGVLVVK